MLLSVRGSLQPMFFMLPSYWASILCRRSLHFSSLYTGRRRASGQEAPRGGPHLLPRTPYHLCECIFGAVFTLWRFVGVRSYKQVFSKKQQQQQQQPKEKRKEIVALNGKLLKGLISKFAVRSPGVVLFLSFLHFFLLLHRLVLFFVVVVFQTVSHSFIWHYLGKECRCW